MSWEDNQSDRIRYSHCGLVKGRWGCDYCMEKPSTLEFVILSVSLPSFPSLRTINTRYNSGLCDRLRVSFELDTITDLIGVCAGQEVLPNPGPADHGVVGNPCNPLLQLLHSLVDKIILIPSCVVENIVYPSKFIRIQQSGR